MAVLGLDHVQIAIPQGGEDRARAFYGEGLGMTEVPKPPNLSPTGCWFESAAVNLHVGIDPDFTPARKAHPALLVDDFAALRERLESAGYATRDDKPIEGYARFFAEDPFGNQIELMQRL
ncbi:MAG: VOC family protein [Erythrobacter sp.]|uniref:VOC family protein n=1 Tax=Erythrobacter sp. TaxID=1042 RepID=UPI00262A2A2D|nr:VOC family protein [Erythrobacter sp.]MDJ0979731.1 VOC family protein [Erythrobacter sp.]